MELYLQNAGLLSKIIDSSIACHHQSESLNGEVGKRVQLLRFEGQVWCGHLSNMVKTQSSQASWSILFKIKCV